jgi:hypothetical protein
MKAANPAWSLRTCLALAGLALGSVASATPTENLGIRVLPAPAKVVARFIDETPLNNPGQTIADNGFAGDRLQIRTYFLAGHAPGTRTAFHRKEMLHDGDTASLKVPNPRPAAWAPPVRGTKGPE